MKMKKNIIFFYIFFYSLCINAQTRIAGKVIDEQGNPIPFANIIFKKSNIGTASDEHGKFSFYTEKHFSTIEVSCVGYASKEVKLKGHDNQNLKIVLIEGEELEAVTIIAKPKKHLSKKENPAYKILQQIWAHKRKNGLKLVKSYEYERYSTTELGLNNLDSVFLKKALQSEYQEIRNILSDKKYKEYFSMPMYLKENVERVYRNNEIQKTRVDLIAERTQGVVQTGFGLERISRAFQEFDIYDNSFLILDKPFVSPISEFGYSVYSYVLSDSLVTDDKKTYTIHFFPREDQDLLLQGNFKVNNQNYAIEEIQMYTTKDINMNLVRSLAFEKSFQIIGDSLYLPLKDVYEGDFTLLSKKDDQKGLYVKKNISYSDYQLNTPQATDFYDENIIKIKANQFEKTIEYWNEYTIGDKEMTKTKNLIQKVGSNRRIKGISDAINIIATGYIPIGNYIEYGSIWEAVTFNNVEGTRLRFGFRSFSSPEDRFRTYTYGAYGTKDGIFKYGISAKYLLSQQPRVVVGGAFQNDYLQLGSLLQQDNSQLNLKSYTNFWFARGENYFLTRTKKLQGILDFGFLGSNLHLTLSGIYAQNKAADPSHFSIGYQTEKGIENIYADANIGASITYTPKRNVYGYGVEQLYGRNVFPTFSLKYTQGIKGIHNSAFDYQKIEGLINIPVPVWQFGMLSTTIEAGKTFGTVPLPLLSPTPANQTYSIVDRTFMLLDYYDFVTDAYLNVYAEHHFNGFIFNKLPLIKKTKWRSVIFGRMAYGNISEKNINISKSNIIYNAPEQLYWEYGFGIENIGLGNLRPIRVDFIWRNDFLDLNGVRNPKFGIRVKIRPEF